MSFSSIYLKNAIGILMRIVLNPYIALGNTTIVIMLILPVHEHKICFHFLMSFSIYINNAL